MIHSVIHSFRHALMITIFVVSMMLILEFINVVSRGRWLGKLQVFRLGQNVLGALLGGLPGCLGAFSVVTMYAHRVVKLGAVVATMIATSGDEAFVMFALFPREALWLTLLLILIGVVMGWITDRFLFPGREACVGCKAGFTLHEEHAPFTLSLPRIWRQLQSGHVIRPLLLLVVVGFITLLATSRLGHGFGWEQITLIGVGLVTLLVILVADEHFLLDHLWKHVILKHVLKVFGWIFATLLVLEFVRRFQLEGHLFENPLALIFVSAFVGIIPQSGPHLLFVNMFAQGMAPFSVLLASSISQDGHGSLPLLAHSRRDFFIVKGINVVAGILFGILAFLLGY